MLMYSVVVFTPSDTTQQNCIVASRTDSCVDPISLIQPNPAPGITDVDPTQPTDQQIWQAKTVFIVLKEYCTLSVKVKGKVFPYSLSSVGPGADPGVQAVSPQVT